MESATFGTNERVQSTRASLPVSFQLGEFGEVGGLVEVATGPMSQLFWKVNEIQVFIFFSDRPSVLDAQCQLIGTDSNCGAENAPVFKIIYVGEFEIV